MIEAVTIYLLRYQVLQKSVPTKEAKALSNWSPMMMRKVIHVPKQYTVTTVEVALLPHTPEEVNIT